MNSKPINACGFVAFACETKAGEYVDVNISNTDGLYEVGPYFYTKGLAQPVLQETGEHLTPRTAGWLNLENIGHSASTSGTLRINFIEDTEWICFPNRLNEHKGIPNLASLIVDLGQSEIVENNSNLFLARGKINLDGKDFSAPCQIRIRTGDKQLTVLEKSYILKFL